MQRSPAKGVEQALAHVCTVVSICAYNTSKKCTECGEVLGALQVPHVHAGSRVMRPVYQVRLCSNKAFNAHVNRDVNAARNMLAVLQVRARGEDRPLALRRPGQDPGSDSGIDNGGGSGRDRE